MEANELRIGNYVDSEIYGIFKIIAMIIFPDGSNTLFKNLNYYPESIKIENAKPILLTEDILLKCGFEKRQESDNFFYFGYGINPITKDWILCLKYFKDENIFFFLNGHHNIKYLHQLQNLYFALTNQELEIEL